MLDPFSSAKAVLRRANKHIADLESAVEIFKSGEPYTTVIEYDPGFERHVLKAKFIPHISEEMSCIMFDAVNNLRSCLDQMTYAVSVKHTGIEKWAGFPFADCVENLPNSIKSLEKNERVPPEILSLFELFQPYKGGNNSLWAMNYLANVKKHALLVPVGFGAGAMLSFPLGRPDREFLSTPAHLNRKDEITILAMRADDPVPKIKLSSFVVIDHPEEVIQGKQPVSLLKIMAGHVANVLRDTEAVCNGIGLFKPTA